MNRWRLINAKLLHEQLADESEATKGDFEVQLECILADPYDPPGLVVHPLRGREADGFLVAYFGEGWYVTYRPVQRRTPPIMGNDVEIHAVVRSDI